MKTAISIPERVFASGEKLRKRLGATRSALYARALAELLERHEADAITARLDAAHGPGGIRSKLDPAWRRAALRTLKRGE
jgi:hypothetical protein